MRGRRPAEEKVVALAEEGAPLHNLEERARMRLEEIRPEGLTGELRWTFDRLALPLCHPTVDRLKPSNVFMFRQLCAAVVRHERLTLELEETGETYESETRNGVQIKARPEVAQLNETFRQIRGLTLIELHNAFDTVSVPIRIRDDRMRRKANSIRFQNQVLHNLTGRFQVLPQQGRRHCQRLAGVVKPCGICRVNGKCPRRPDVGSCQVTD